MNRPRGVTVLEVLLVVAIVALLAVLILPYITNQVFKGYDARRKSDINRIGKALEEIYTDTDCYPEFLPACTPGDDLKPYLSKIPCDPQTDLSYVYYPNPDAPSCPTWYWLFTDLENPADQQSTDLGCQDGCGPSEASTYYEYYGSSPNAPQPFFGTQGSDPPPGCSSDFYGCFTGVCTPLCAPGGRPECDPNYSNSTCYGLCGNPANACI